MINPCSPEQLERVEGLTWQTLETFDPNVDGESVYALEGALDDHGALWLRYTNDRDLLFALPTSVVHRIFDATMSPDDHSVRYAPKRDAVLVLRSNGDCEMYRPVGETIVGRAIVEASRNLENFDRLLGVAAHTKKANA